MKKYYYVRPSMAQFIELMLVEGKREQFKLMPFLKYMFKLYAEPQEQKMM